MGPKTALKLVREHKNIETILTKIDRQKYIVPESWVPNEVTKKEGDDSTEDEETNAEGDENSHGKEGQDGASKVDALPAYVQARKLFNEHEVSDDVELKWKPCQAEALTKYLVEDMGFNPDRVKSNIAKLQEAYKKTSKPQTRMDSFFAIKPNPNAAAKRKAAAASAKKTTKKVKGGRRK